MSVSRWEPFRELAVLEDRMRRMLREGGMPGEAETSERRWVPPVDVIETEREFVMRFDVPGVSEDAIAVEIDEGTLSVSGERAGERGQEGEHYHRRERTFGAFTRSIPLPQGVDEEKIQADYSAGVLEVRVPKPEQQQPRRITIGSSRSG